jgi:caffeoyl-CoA O-methyltransferase
MSLSYLPLTDGLYQYLVEQRSDMDDPLLNALRAETLKLGPISQMAISPDQASLLTLLAGIMGATQAVEVGTFTGSSSIAIARGLMPRGKLTCFDQDFKWTSIARRYWFTAGLQDRIELKLGNARDLLKRFRPSKPLDLVFIDADKESYDVYYELLLPHVRPGGLIIFDNMLNGGKVVDPAERNSPVTKAIDTMNRKLAIDPRVQAVLIPVADGLQLCRKW